MLEHLDGVAKERVNDSLITLSNGVELGLQVIREVMGSDIGTSIYSNSLSNEQINSILISKIREEVELRDVDLKEEESNRDAFSYNAY